MIERHHLKVITEIHRTGTLTGAAENLHLTQSAISHGMKKLEHTLGAKLWEKDGRRLRLSDAGLAILNLAQRVIPQFEHAEEQIGLIGSGHQGGEVLSVHKALA